MRIVTYHALDAAGRPLVVARLTLREALDLAAAHLGAGTTPVALELDRRRFDAAMIQALLDVRQGNTATRPQQPR